MGSSRNLELNGIFVHSVKDQRIFNIVLCVPLTTSKGNGQKMRGYTSPVLL